MINLVNFKYINECQREVVTNCSVGWEIKGSAFAPIKELSLSVTLLKSHVGAVYAYGPMVV